MDVLEMHWNVRVEEYDQANNKPPAFYKYLLARPLFLLVEVPEYSCPWVSDKVTAVLEIANIQLVYG